MGKGVEKGEKGIRGPQEEVQPWLLRRERVQKVVAGTLLLTGNVPVARTWVRAASRSGMEMASGQSQSASPSLMGSLGELVSKNQR